MTRRSILVAGFAAALALPAALAGQQPPPPRDTTELVFEREIFMYPSYQRRSPFQTLANGGDEGPRFEELQLLGIIYSDNPALSVALLGVGNVQSGDVSLESGGQEGAPVQANAPGSGFEAFRVRRGQRVGNTRILEIQRMRIIVEVEEFGLTEQRMLELPRARQGGPE